MELSATTFGYCTNVHANASLEKTRANLEEHALGVKVFLTVISMSRW
jgi:hypothetical protein